MYETMQRTTRRRLSQALKWVGAAALLLSCVVAVYLGAVLLARLALRAFYP